MRSFKKGLNKRQREIADQVVNKIRHTLERFDQRCTLNNPRFAESHLKSKLKFLIHFCIGGVDEEYVAVFQRELSVGGPEEDL